MVNGQEGSFQEGSFEDTEVPDADAVPQRCRELGIEVPLLLQGIRQGQLAADFCTNSHPRSYPGMRAWGETNGAIRTALSGEGWSLRDDDNIPIIVSPNGAVSLTAISGNQNAGLRDRKAGTRRPRRTAGVRIVRINAQIEMVQLLNEGESGDEIPAVLQTPTWFRLYFREKDLVRSELSLARAVTVGGTLLDWTERLILPEINMLDGPEGGGHELEAQDVEVPVERRAG